MSTVDHSPTTGVVSVLVILIAVAALGALICGCWCYLRLQRAGEGAPEDQESMVADPPTIHEPFLLPPVAAKAPCPDFHFVVKLIRSQSQHYDAGWKQGGRH
uniref:Stannin transmembrane domain-containing protein n=1 Tax=Eptatretus burgeri TaxID=7764 RepID=A0A8C4Q215_EPTBU